MRWTPGEAATGPFYCPGDHKVYIDLGFYQELAQRFGAPGDFAQAYVIAHEIGHHVQRLLGTEARVRQLQGRRPDAANQLSVALELQADCYAGVWGSFAKQKGELDPGDVEEGLNAAAAVADDRLQRMSTGRVSPESFTHGSADQRSHWFQQGFQGAGSTPATPSGPNSRSLTARAVGGNLSADPFVTRGWSPRSSRSHPVPEAACRMSP